MLAAMDMAPPRTAPVAASRRTRRHGHGAEDGSCGGACGEGEGGAVESSISVARWSCVCRDATALRNQEVEEAHGSGGRSSEPDIFLEKYCCLVRKLYFSACNRLKHP